MKPLRHIPVLLGVSAMCTAASGPIDQEVLEALVKQGMAREQVTSWYNACDSGGAMSMKVCFRYRLTVQERRLAKALTRLKGSCAALEEGERKVSCESENGVASLDEAQEAWRTFVRIECSRQADMGYFDYGVIALACELAKTTERADRIELEADEGEKR